MRKNIKSAAVLVLMLAVATGCGSKGQTILTSDVSIEEDSFSVSDDVAYLGNDNIGADESMTESEMIATAGDTESTKGNIKEELPDYLKGDASGSGSASKAQDDSAIPSDVGEGRNIETGAQITAAENAESCKLGETYTINTRYGDMELTVLSVDVVKNKDKLSSAPKIVRVNYSYSNVGAVSGVMITDLFFRMADDGGKALPVYIPDYMQDENPEPQVVEKGESCDAVICYELYDNPDELTLFFDDQTTGAVEPQELFWVIKN